MKNLKKLRVTELSNKEKMNNNGGMLALFLGAIWAGYCYENYKQTGSYHPIFN